MAPRLLSRKACQVVLVGSLCVSVAVTFFMLGRTSTPGTRPSPHHVHGGATSGLPEMIVGGDVVREPGNAGFTEAGTALAPSAAAMAFARHMFSPDRYRMHVSTDKPTYRPGETVRVRGVVLGVSSMAPFLTEEGDRRQATVEVKFVSPKGDVVSGPVRAVIQDASFGAEWVVPAHGMPGGTFTVKADAAKAGWAPAQRQFAVHAFSNPSMRMQVTFLRDGYGAGDTVAATVTATRATGGVPVGAPFTFSARVGGGEVAHGEGTVDAAGHGDVAFALPAALADDAQGSVHVVVRDGGDVGSVSKTLPLLTAAFDIDVYPEGGDLVAGVPTRVYVEGTNAAGDAADFEADIVSVQADGSVIASVATVVTEHEGRGVSTLFVPSVGTHGANVNAGVHGYQLRVTKPVAVRKAVSLPDVKPRGGAITLPEAVHDAVFDVHQPVSLHVAASHAGAYRIALFRQEREVSQALVHFASHEDARAGTSSVLTLSSAATASGVLRATLYDVARNLPVAERLLFRRPKTLDIRVTPDKDVYKPGDTVKLAIRTTLGGTDTPVPAAFGVTVVDDSVLQRVDRAKQPPRLPAMAFLEPEVNTLHDPHAYLADQFQTALQDVRKAGDAASPARAMDLLLGTQGWRRFVYEAPQTFTGRHSMHAGYHRRHPDLPEVDEDTYLRFLRLFGVCPRPERRHKLARPQPLMGGVMDGAVRMFGGARPVMAAGTPPMRGGPPPPPMPMPMAEPEMAMAEAGAGAGGGEMDMGVEKMNMAMAAGAEDEEAAVAQAATVADAGGVGGDMAMANNADFAAKDDADADADADAGPHAPPPPPMAMPMAPPPPMAKPLVMDEGLPEDVARVAPAQAAKRHKRVYVGRHGGVQVTRQFAFARRKDRQPNDRMDFTDTVFWAASLTTNTDGQHHVSFDLSDSVTSFRVEVDAFAASLLGSATLELRCVEPFYARMAMPNQLTDGDRLQLPITTTLAAAPAAGAGVDASPAKVALVPAVKGAALRLGPDVAGDGMEGEQAQRTQRWYVPATAVAPPLPAPPAKKSSVEGDGNGDGDGDGDGNVSSPAEGDLGMLATSQPSRTRQVQHASVSLTATATYQGQVYVDRVVRDAHVVPRGFPAHQSEGFMLKAGEAHEWAATLPHSMVANSVSASVVAYPTPVANIAKALEALLRQPCGCFEQTSSTTFPLTMAAQYFQSHSGVDPSLVARSKELLTDGYKKLVTFESDDGGFEWFGQSPGHEALTAYGVLQFEEMAKVMSVDAAMLQRTREWLLSRRDRKGGFERNPKSLDSFGRAPDEITNAYIVWALTATSMRSQLKEEVDALAAAADESKGGAFKEDPYFLGLVAGALFNVGDTERGVDVAQRLVALQSADGSIDGAETSITCSRARSLAVEATSMAALAWMNDERFTTNARDAVQWITSQCQGGRFGSTQATVLALKAIIAYDVLNARPATSGSISLAVGGRVVQTKTFDADIQGAIVFDPDVFVPHLNIGEPTTVTMSMTIDDKEKKVQMPASILVEYNTHEPSSAADAPVTIATRLSDTVVEESGATELVVELRNTADKAQPMILAQVGIPGGLDVRVAKLDELQAAGDFAFYELGDRQVNLYLRGMAPNQVLRFPLDVTAVTPGEFTGDASSVAPYYAEELKSWASPVTVQVFKQPAAE